MLVYCILYSYIADKGRKLTQFNSILKLVMFSIKRADVV